MRKPLFFLKFFEGSYTLRAEEITGFAYKEISKIILHGFTGHVNMSEA